MRFQLDDPAPVSDSIRRIRAHFEEGIALSRECVELLCEPIEQAIGRLSEALLANRRIYVCGNGGSAADALHFAGEMMGRFERERPGLAVMALSANTATLTSLANDYTYDEIYSRQVAALGQRGDVFVVITTSSTSPNILQAVRAAHDREMHVVALTGREGGTLRAELRSEDIEICVPHQRTQRIQEAQLTILHVLCDGVDQHLLGPD